MRKIILLVVSILLIQASAFAGDHLIIVQLGSTQNLPDVTSALKAKVVDHIPGTSTYLMKVPSLPAVTSHAGLGIQEIEFDGVVSIRKRSAMGILSTSQGADWYGNQPAMRLVRADDAHRISKGRGVVIADLNSRIDYGHPALAGHLIGGYDFVSGRTGDGSLNQSSANFLDQSNASFLDQSNASFLDQSNASFLDQSNASFLDQSTATFLDQSMASFMDQSNASFLDMTNPAHGHGTMVAGLLAAVAPEAMIMPLRVFDDEGSAETFAIAKAIRHAVANGAHVINMSFGLDMPSAQIRNAIQHAIASGVTVVASAGNNNTAEPQYPAAHNGVLAVAATDLRDKKADFSNYGETVFVTAPGVNIISAYPGGYYALASGTSFSAPFVAGEAALLRSMRWNEVSSEIADGTVKLDPKNHDYSGLLGNGRIDVMKAMKGLK